MFVIYIIWDFLYFVNTYLLGILKIMKTTHYSKEPEYYVWRSMRARCHYESSKDYPNYGGRGIRVCKRWDSRGGYLNFIEDMGHRPNSSYSIDRIDNDGPYSPENCQWASKTQQILNRQTTNKHMGITQRKDGLWVARMMFDKQLVLLELFNSFDEALNARHKAEAKYWGFVNNKTS
jgi:hypothetical protein